jgi:hypothetical protein
VSAGGRGKAKAEKQILVITVPFSPSSIQTQVDTLLEAKQVSPRREGLIRWLLHPSAWDRTKGDAGTGHEWVRYIRMNTAVAQASRGLHKVRFNALMEIMDDKERLLHLYKHNSPRAVVEHIESQLEFEAYVENLLPLLRVMKALQIDIELITLDEYKRRRRRIRIKDRLDSAPGKGARFEF